MKPICAVLLCLSIFALNFSFAQQNKFNHVSQSESTQIEQAVTKQNKTARAIESLDMKLKHILKANEIVGMSYAIIDSQGNRYTKGLGLAKLEGNVPATADTIFRIGSISKMFVGLAALKLESEGKLDLQAPLRELLPEIEFENPYSQNSPVRIIHLLQHSAGWDDIHLVEYANNDPTPLTLREGLDFHPSSRKSRWPPGERMSYTNSGSAVVAYLIQTITGIEFEEYVTAHFFEPLRMKSTTFRLPSGNLPVADLHRSGKAVDYQHLIMRPSGALNASAQDMSNLLEFFIQGGEFDGEQLLTTPLIQKMEQPSTTNAARAGLKTGYGITNYTSAYRSFVFHGHSGGVSGGASEFYYLPELGVGYALMVNSATQSTVELSRAIRAYLVKGVSDRPEMPKVDMSQLSQIAEFEGYYMLASPRPEMMRFIDQITEVFSLKLEANGVYLGNQKLHPLAHATNPNIDISFQPFQLWQLNNKKGILLRNRGEASPNAILLTDSQGKAIEVNSGYFIQITALRHFTQQGFLWMFLILLLIHPLWYLIWQYRRLMRRIVSGPTIQVRIWTLVASTSAIGLVISAVMVQMVDAAILGKPTPIAIGIMLFTYGFALFTFISLVQNIRYMTNQGINIATRTFCLLSSFVYAVVAVYLASFGLIGLQTFS